MENSTTPQQSFSQKEENGKRQGNNQTKKKERKRGDTLVRTLEMTGKRKKSQTMPGEVRVINGRADRQKIQNLQRLQKAIEKGQGHGNKLDDRATGRGKGKWWGEETRKIPRTLLRTTTTETNRRKKLGPSRKSTSRVPTQIHF